MLENLSQPHANLTALDDVRRSSGIKIENHAAWRANVLRQRQRWVEFDGGEICDPNKCRQIVCQNVIYGALVPFAPDGRCLYPIRPVLGGIFFKEKFLVDSSGIALQG